MPRTLKMNIQELLEAYSKEVKEAAERFHEVLWKAALEEIDERRKAKIDRSPESDREPR